VCFAIPNPGEWAAAVPRGWQFAARVHALVGARARRLRCAAPLRPSLCGRSSDNPFMPSRPEPPPRTPASGPPRLGECELEELQSLLDRVPPPLEPLDVSMLDGFLCGVLVQPREVPPARWLPHITDADGRALPRSFDARRLHELALRRHAELNDAIVHRRWFDPLVFELSDGAEEAPEDDDSAPQAVDAVYPWVAGFATAMELFPQLLESASDALNEPLALLYRHLDPDDLEDADQLIAEIDSLEPPADLGEAVEGLVRATLLLADVGRPNANGGTSSARQPTRPGQPRRPPPRRH
jgi:uncharacterized protein